MALPKSYLTTIKNLVGIMNSIVGAQAPKKFTTRFLESLGYKTSSDRLIIGVLKSLEFLTDDGTPMQRYHEYLDQTRSATVLGEAIRAAYADLFQINKNANTMAKAEVLNKLKTLSQGQYSDSVLDKMAMTFTALCGLAEFTITKLPSTQGDSESEDADSALDTDRSNSKDDFDQRIPINGLVYNIQLILPESRDPKVYDVLFESLRKHLK